MKVSILLPDLRVGGAERVNLDLASALGALGHDVTFVLRQAVGEYLSEARLQWPVIDLDARRVREVPSRLTAHLRSGAPDAVIANMWPLTTVTVVAWLLARSSARLLLVDHGILSSAYRDWGFLHSAIMKGSMRLSYPRADAVVGVSQGVASDVAALAGLADDRVKVIHNPIPPKPWPDDSAIHAVNARWLSSGQRRILAVGTLKPVKNFSLLLDAIARLPHEVAQLMIVGSGAEKGHLHQQAERLGIADRVIFAGYQSDPSPFYATADLFVLSSNHEGFGNVLVEALSFGCPVVSTDCSSGPAEILEGGKWGRLVPVGDADALSKAILTSLQEHRDPGVLRRRAADFRPEVAAQRYLDALGLS